MATSTTTSVRTPLQQVAGAVGAVFLLVGILGFVPGITTGSLSFAGSGSDAHLLGIFEVSVLHNVVHLLFGVAGLAMARSGGAAKSYLVGGGAVYLALGIVGPFLEGNANFVPVNAADNVLHVVLGVAMAGLGLLLARAPRNG